MVFPPGQINLAQTLTSQEGSIRIEISAYGNPELSGEESKALGKQAGSANVVTGSNFRAVDPRKQETSHREISCLSPFLPAGVSLSKHPSTAMAKPKFLPVEISNLFGFQNKQPPSH
jgi:hypothetical protein